jgi:hypothetical protein
METYRPPGSVPRATTTARATNMLQPTPFRFEANNRTGTETQTSSQHHFTRAWCLLPVCACAAAQPARVAPSISCRTACISYCMVRPDAGSKGLSGAAQTTVTSTTSRSFHDTQTARARQTFAMAPTVWRSGHQRCRRPWSAILPTVLVFAAPVRMDSTTATSTSSAVYQGTTELRSNPERGFRHELDDLCLSEGE